MLWLNRNEPYVHEQWYEEDFFCLKPRTTIEGITVWLEKIIRARQWYGHGVNWFHKTEYRATDRQKAAVGLKW